MTNPDAPTTPADGIVERVSRWTARRTTRRSALARTGRAAMLLAVGSSFALAMEERAEARVCGQSGVAPKCATYDCSATWGWCWYASGCCAGGQLKKICDCCAPNTPHPVGYCPSGTRVLCIMESCGEDPRLMRRPVLRPDADPIDLALEASAIRYPGGSPGVVIGDANDPGWTALAASIGRIVDGPVLLTGRGGLDDRVARELARLRAEHAWIVSPEPGRIDGALSGVRGNVPVDAGDVESASGQLAEWSRQRSGARRAVVVTAGGTRALGSAAALAHGTGVPLIIAPADRAAALLTEPRDVRAVTVVAGSESEAGDLPGATVIASDSATELAARVAARHHIAAPAPTLCVAQVEDLDSAVALSTWRAPVGLVDSGLGPLLGLALEVRTDLEQAVLVGDHGSGVVHDLQSVINEFEAHLLTGSAGQGLPVIPQPHDERPVPTAEPHEPTPW